MVWLDWVIGQFPFGVPSNLLHKSWNVLSVVLILEMHDTWYLASSVYTTWTRLVLSIRLIFISVSLSVCLNFEDIKSLSSDARVCT